MQIDYSNISQEAPPPSRQYVEGYTAFNVGRGEAANPYEQGSKSHESWNCGWCDAEGYDEYVNPSLDSIH